MIARTGSRLQTRGSAASSSTTSSFGRRDVDGVPSSADPPCRGLGRGAEGFGPLAGAELMTPLRIATPPTGAIAVGLHPHAARVYSIDGSGS